MFQSKTFPLLFFLLSTVIPFFSQSKLFANNAGSRNVLEPTYETKAPKGRHASNVLETEDDDDEAFFANYSPRIIPSNSFIFAEAAEEPEKDVKP